MKSRLFLIPLLIFGILTAGLGAALWQNLRHGAVSRFAQHVGDMAPGMAMDGFDPAAWHGRPYILNFFASWCAPCRAEAEALAALQGAGAVVVGIDYRDSAAATAKFLNDVGNPYVQIAHDDKGELAIGWGATGVPETFVVDKDGIIKLHEAGPLTEALVADEILPVWRGLQ